MKIAIIFILVVIFSIQDQCSADGGAGAIGLSSDFNPIQTFFDWIGSAFESSEEPKPKPKPTNNNEKNPPDPPSPPEITIQIEERDRIDYDDAREIFTTLLLFKDDISIKPKDYCIGEKDYIKYPPNLIKFKEELNDYVVCYNSLCDTYNEQITSSINDCKRLRSQEINGFEAIKDLVKAANKLSTWQQHGNFKKQFDVLFNVIYFAFYAQANITSLLENVSEKLTPMKSYMTSFHNVISINTQRATDIKAAYRSDYRITSDSATGTEYRHRTSSAVFKPFQDLDKSLRQGEKQLQRCLSNVRHMNCHSFLVYVLVARLHIAQFSKRVNDSQKNNKRINWRYEMIKLKALLSEGNKIKLNFNTAIENGKSFQTCFSEFIMTFPKELEKVAKDIKEGLQY